MNIDQLFLSCLGSGERLKWEIDNDINLAEQGNKEVLIAIDVFVSLIQKRKKEEMFKNVNTNSILDLLKKERPDIFGILADHPNGKFWVGQQIKNLRKRFL